MIATRAVTKRYGSTTAVRELSFDVMPGVVTGFLGPNGSGKSTTMRIIMGLDRPDGGAAMINGKPFAELRWPLREVGALLEAKAFHPGRTAYNHLRWLAATNDIPRRRIDEVLDTVGLTSVANHRAGKFSLGMGQRLGIAAALLGDPGVLLFDEPVNGLDPEGIRWVRHLLRGLAAEGRTVFVSSHLIAEMSLTAQELIVIGRGKLIAQTSVKDFTDRTATTGARVVTPMLERFLPVLKEAGSATETDEDGGIVVSGMTSAQIGELAASHLVTLHELTPVRASLEDAFMTLTQDEVEFRAGGGAAAAGHRAAAVTRTPASVGKETS
jgi:ABC-2 type transport system ATP-binding protein